MQSDVIILGIFLSTEYLARNIQEYEVIVPQVVTNTGSFLSNELKDGIGNERLFIRFRAFGEEFLLDLRKNRKLMDPKFTSEILDNLHQPPRVNLSRDCYYTGSLRFRSQSSVALSGCHGLVRAHNICFVYSARTVLLTNRSKSVLDVHVLADPGKRFASSVITSQSAER